MVSSGGLVYEIEMVGEGFDHLPSLPFRNSFVLSFQVDVEKERVQSRQPLSIPRLRAGLVSVYRKEEVELLVIRDFLRSQEFFGGNVFDSFPDEQGSPFQPKGNPLLEYFVVGFVCHN